VDLTRLCWVSHWARETLGYHWELYLIVSEDEHTLTYRDALSRALVSGDCPECGTTYFIGPLSVTIQRLDYSAWYAAHHKPQQHTIDGEVTGHTRHTVDVWTMDTKEYEHMGKLREVVPTLRLLPNTSYDVIVDGSVDVEEQTVSTRDGKERIVNYFLAKTLEGSPLRIAAGEQLKDKIALAIGNTKGPVKLHISRDPTGFYYEVTRL
jgi:hypothetical protein